MDHQLAQEVIACLPDERNVFYYYRDRYSIGLLRYLSRNAKQGLSIAELKKSNYAALLRKPRVRTVMANFGKIPLTEEDWFYHDYDEQQEVFVLTLGLWGDEEGSSRNSRRWQQTSRSGCNLVLQMNFSGEHDAQYAKLGLENGDSPFAWYAHPISKQRHTLAWARIDLDFASDTALIEEIQNDWLREVIYLEKAISRKLKAGVTLESQTDLWDVNCSLKVAQQYCRFVLERYTTIWDEAMLWAAINFLREEIGIKHIFYHSVDSGRLLKRIGGSLPPRSLYTDLPRRFCFVPTQEAPEFLCRESRFHRVAKAYKNLNFFKLPELQMV